MIKVFAILSVSLVVGYLLRRRHRLVSACDRLTTPAIWALLLVLGIWVGSNEDVMSNLSSLSLQAGAICAGAVIGSLTVCRLIEAVLFRRPGDGS